MAKRLKRKAPPKKEYFIPVSHELGPETVDTVVFRSGNSDAVRLPKRFGLVGKTVVVRRESPSRIVIEIEGKRTWPPGFFDLFKGGDYGFELPPREKPDPAEEERLSRIFDDPEK